MIKSMSNADIFTDLKRNEHILFSLPLEGGKWALEEVDPDEGGYGFLHELADRHGVPVPDAPEMPTAADSFGEIWSWRDEDRAVTYHGLYNHHTALGWHRAAYTLVVPKLDVWWNRLDREDELTGRPIRSLILGSGRHLSVVARHNEGAPWRYREGMAVLANTEAELHLYWAD